MVGINKTIVLDSGIEVSFWIAEIVFGDVLNNNGNITLRGWKDVDAYKTGKASVTIRNAVLKNFSTLENYTAFWSSVATELLTNTEFVGGTLQDSEAP